MRARASMTLLALLLLSGCSGSRLAVDMMAPVLRNTTDFALRSDDPQLVADALPTSLLLIEGMLETNPGQEEIAVLGSMLYFAYAFAVVEDRDPERASGYYDRGRELGWQALDEEGIESAVTEGTFERLNEALPKLREKQSEALLWICANWAMWIQLNLGETRAAADLARVMPLADRLAELDETLLHGLPRILLGALHAGRPVMLGGNPDRARVEFERAFEISERNMLMAQVFFARFYCTLVFDREAWEASLREVRDAPAGLLPDAELLNQIARLKAEQLWAQTEEIFE